jgi:hypothetical protein
MPVKAVCDTPDITAVFVFLQSAKHLKTMCCYLLLNLNIVQVMHISQSSLRNIKKAPAGAFDVKQRTR